MLEEVAGNAADDGDREKVSATGCARVRMLTPLDRLDVYAELGRELGLRESGERARRPDPRRVRARGTQPSRAVHVWMVMGSGERRGGWGHERAVPPAVAREQSFCPPDRGTLAAAMRATEPQPTVIERQLTAMLRVVQRDRAARAMAVDEAAEDLASAKRVMAALRREQHARDGRPAGRTWGLIADRVERHYRLR